MCQPKRQGLTVPISIRKDAAACNMHLTRSATYFFQVSAHLMYNEVAFCATMADGLKRSCSRKHLQSDYQFTLACHFKLAQ
jgi:hypothetical protein